MNEAKIFFNNDYTGPRWTYALLYRPLSGCHAPQGWIIFSDRKHPEYLFGTVDFPFPLTNEWIEGYQLKAMGHQKGILCDR